MSRWTVGLQLDKKIVENSVVVQKKLQCKQFGKQWMMWKISPIKEKVAVAWMIQRRNTKEKIFPWLREAYQKEQRGDISVSNLDFR